MSSPTAPICDCHAAPKLAPRLPSATCSAVEPCNLLSAAFEADPQPRAIVDGRMRVVQANAAWQALTGHTCTWDWLAGVHVHDAAILASRLGVALDAQAPAGLTVLAQARLHGPQTSTPCALSLTRLAHEGDGSLLLTALPLSPLPASLFRSSEDLAALASALSHDLGQHARLITAFSSLLAREDIGVRAHSHLATIVGHAERLQETLTRLVRWIRLADEPVRARPCPVAGALREAGADNIDMTFSAAQGAVLADPAMLPSLLSELVANARRYGGRTAHLDLHVMDAGVVLEISDDGPGIPCSERERVLRPLVRLHTWEQAPGSGMGLPIAVRIAQRHGGWLRVADAVPAGCLVQVLFPH